MRIEMAPSDPNQNFSEPWGGVSISFLRVGLRACCWTHEENRPNLHYVDSRITIQYARRYSTGYLLFPRSKNIPPFTRSFHFLDEKHSLCSQFSIRRIFNIPKNIESNFHSRDGFGMTNCTHKFLVPVLFLVIHIPNFLWTPHLTLSRCSLRGRGPSMLSLVITSHILKSV